MATTEGTVNWYASRYPEFTKKSVFNTIKQIERKGKLNQILVDYYLKPKRFGGLGKGKLKRVM